MKNITLAIDAETLEASRAYAERHQTTLNALVRDLLAKTAHRDRTALASQMFHLMDAFPVRSRKRRWTREELYVRQ